MLGQALNMHNKLNATLGLTHLQYNAQQEKQIQIFFTTPAQWLML